VHPPIRPKGGNDAPDAGDAILQACRSFCATQRAKLLCHVTEFNAIPETRPRGGIAIKLPFDPAAEWGERNRYDLAGTIDGRRVRGKLTLREDAYYLELGAAWCDRRDFAPGGAVLVSLAPEGPQVAAMADDLAAAFNAEPGARRFFESLPTFYRKNFMRWIDSAKRPETRARRIAETIATLKAGKRER